MDYTDIETYTEEGYRLALSDVMSSVFRFLSIKDLRMLQMILEEHIDSKLKADN